MRIKTPIQAIAALALAALITPAALASGPSSTNYAIAWDVVDSGGGESSSTNYRIVDSVGQPTALGTSASTNYMLTGGFHSPPDFDADGVKNFMDNCIFEINADQRDSNADGFGNICDPDLNNDLAVNPIDLGRLRLFFFQMPGPSGLVP